MKRMLIVLTYMLLATYSYSMTIGEEDFVCPIDNHEFKANINYSGTSFGMRLDMKPLGPTPAPWLLPVCPECGFPQFKKEINQDEIERYRSYILSHEFQSYTNSNPSYFLLAKIQEFDNAPLNHIAFSYIEASWQVEGKKQDQYRRYLLLALEKYRKFLKNSTEKNDETITAEIMVGEILRQVGKFNEALDQFYKLEKLKETPETIKKIIKREIELCKNKDSEPHGIAN